MGRRRRCKVEHTDDWELLLPLFEWPEQQAYEELRPLVLFGDSVAERSRETGIPERTMYRRVERFGEEGMLSLFGTDPATARAKRRGLEPAIRRMIVELKAEHPRLNDNEISSIVYVRTGRRLGKHTDRRKGPLRGGRPPEALAPVRALPRRPRPQGGARGGGDAAPGRLERQGHSVLPEGEQDDRLPDDREVAREGRGGPRG